jgi:hypothetical protein
MHCGGGVRWKSVRTAYRRSGGVASYGWVVIGDFFCVMVKRRLEGMNERLCH